MIQPFLPSDLPSLAALQPPGWAPLQSPFELYLSHDFARPLKYLQQNTLAGVANSSCFGPSAWLSHIIVHPDRQRQGIASALLAQALSELNSKNVATVSLIATPQGQPLYKKTGFRNVLEYVFFESPEPAAGAVPPVKEDGCIRPYQTSDQSDLIRLDRLAYGEDRSALLSTSLGHAQVWQNKEKVEGFWLPALGEGLILANTKQAGSALLGWRLRQATKTCLPADNAAGLAELRQRGWREIRRAWRMCLGPTLNWRPELVWSRVGGNFG